MNEKGVENGLRSAVLLSILWSAAVVPPALDAQVPLTPEEVLGHALGERFTEPEEVVRYAERLADESPRVRLVRYGETAQGRPLVLLVIAREDRLAALDEILERNARFVRPELAASEAERLAADQPAIVWLSYGVHGDESSSTEAALWTAHDLATGFEGGESLLDSLIVVIDPMLNPDGRARYVSWYRGARGGEPNPEPMTLEHRPPWPGGRFNHFLFDLNRDWAWATQPETRARLAQWFRFYPQVHVDFHEMSWRSTYFFFPPTPPINPFFPEYTLEWGRYFGARLADEFDRRGWLYYTGERFDLFYPGYGDSWPSLWGAIGMTYEQAGGGGAGLAVRRSDGTVLTLADRATRHRTAGRATLRAVAERKSRLLVEFATFHREAAEGRPDILLVPGPDSTAVGALAAVLRTQGLRVERAHRPFRAEARPHPGYSARREFPAGTLRVPARQPGARLAATLLDAETPFDPESQDFSYDLTAWSLPYAYGVEAHSARRAPAEAFPASSGSEDGAVERREESREPGHEGQPRDGSGVGGTGGASPYGWLALPTVEALGPVHRYLALGGRVRALGDAATIEGITWPRGSYFIPGSDSASAWLERSGLASRTAPVRSGRAESGADLGSEGGIVLSAARIAVLAGAGVSPSGYGGAWFFLEREVGIPHDPLPVEALDEGTLAAYDVLVLPPADRPDESTRDVLSAWLRAGGTLIASGGSARWVAEDLAGVPLRADTAPPEPEERLRRGLLTREERRKERWEQALPGVILAAELDPEHPLTWGAGLANEGGGFFVLHREDLQFEPDPDHETAIRLPAEVRPLSGVVDERKRRSLERSGWLVTRKVEDGVAVLFADDPLFRLFWRGTHLPFGQALLLGPSLR